ncbi:MAG: cytochrome c oxidase assembly protein, partial [Alphaproteobacteria bacterium]
TNTSDRDLQARAMYNVVPESTGAYFQKLQCFCFDDQIIKAGETKKFPMLYFVSPEMAEDRETRSVQELTLSYTFYPIQGRPAAQATGAAG